MEQNMESRNWLWGYSFQHQSDFAGVLGEEKGSETKLYQNAHYFTPFLDATCIFHYGIEKTDNLSANVFRRNTSRQRFGDMVKGRTEFPFL
jgi:hypothetical protein